MSAYRENAYEEPPPAPPRSRWPLLLCFFGKHDFEFHTDTPWMGILVERIRRQGAHGDSLYICTHCGAPAVWLDRRYVTLRNVRFLEEPQCMEQGGEGISNLCLYGVNHSSHVSYLEVDLEVRDA
jgi:hypothetical protein